MESELIGSIVKLGPVFVVMVYLLFHMRAQITTLTEDLKTARRRERILLYHMSDLPPEDLSNGE